MIYRRFGRTELQMPVFTCGGMRYQQSWQDLPLSEIHAESQQNVAACIDRALRSGITHIETARGYGSSERQLGQILPGLARDRLIVQTKVPPRDSKEEFLETFQASMDRLQLDYVDLLGFHGLNTADLVRQVFDCGNLEAARQLQREGRVRFVGFSSHAGPAVITEAVNTGEFDYVNLHWFYVDPRNSPAIDAAAKQDMGVFIISPNDKGGMLYDPPEKLTTLCQPFSPMGFNSLFCLSNPAVHTLSLGISRPEQLDPQLAVLDHVEDASAAIAGVLARLEAEKRKVLGEHWLSHWQRGLPEVIPDAVYPYHILRLHDLYLAFDMLAYGKMRYNLLGSGGHWFAGNKVDHVDWTKCAEALKHSPVAHEIAARLRSAHALFNADDKKRLSESEG